MRDTGASRSESRAVDPFQRLGCQDRLERVRDRIHVLRRADRDPEALRQLGRARDVAHQNAVLLQQPPEDLRAGGRVAADQDEVGRARDTP